MVPVSNDSSFGNIIHLANEVIKNLDKNLKKLQNSTVSVITEPYTTPSTFTTPATLTTSLITTPKLNTTMTEMKTTTSSYITIPRRPPISPTDPSIKSKTPNTQGASAAVVIIVICLILIVIIVITILVLLFNRRTETNYKIESHKSFNNNQNQNERKPLSVLLPKESHSNMQSNLLTPPSNINNNLRMGNKVKKRQDVKEWYV